MKIVELEIQNMKRIRAVQIRPQGNVVTLTGANGAGKSSILDAIASVFTGAANLPKEPVRNGETEAFVRLDMGAIVVRREFDVVEDETEKSTLTRLIVESAEGARYPSPQKFIDALYSELTFDPSEFIRMKPKDRLEALRAVAPLDVDADEIDRLNAGDYAKRTEWGRLFNSMKERERAARERVDDSEVTPIDVDALNAAYNDAVERNAQINSAAATRKARADEIARHKTFIASLDEEIERLQAKRRGVVDSLAQYEAAAAKEKPLPLLVDTTALALDIKSANEENRRRAHQAGHRAELERTREERVNAEQMVDSLTAAMQARTKVKEGAIARLKMPIEGLAYGDGVIRYNGVPFEQASAAEQLRIAMAIAMAKNPKVRVILVRDASLFDVDSMEAIYAMAAEKDFQVWIEVAEKEGRVGILIEDGEVAAVDGTRVAAHAG